MLVCSSERYKLQLQRNTSKQIHRPNDTQLKAYRPLVIVKHYLTSLNSVRGTCIVQFCKRLQQGCNRHMYTCIHVYVCIPKSPFYAPWCEWHYCFLFLEYYFCFFCA